MFPRLCERRDDLLPGVNPSQDPANLKRLFWALQDDTFLLVATSYAAELTDASSWF